jgi:hypothetical protein
MKYAYEYKKKRPVNHWLEIENWWIRRLRDGCQLTDLGTYTFKTFHSAIGPSNINTFFVTWYLTGALSVKLRLVVINNRNHAGKVLQRERSRQTPRR